MKIAGKLVYSANIIVILLTIFTGYGEVSKNLDGWRDFTSGDAFIFVLIGIIMIALCAYNILMPVKDGVNMVNYIVGAALIVLPIYFHITAANLQGNVESDAQYLMLRTFQGFDSMWWLIVIVSALGLFSLILPKLKK